MAEVVLHKLELEDEVRERLLEIARSQALGRSFAVRRCGWGRSEAEPPARERG